MKGLITSALIASLSLGSYVAIAADMPRERSKILLLETQNGHKTRVIVPGSEVHKLRNATPRDGDLLRASRAEPAFRTSPRND